MGRLEQHRRRGSLTFCVSDQKLHLLSVLPPVSPPDSTPAGAGVQHRVPLCLLMSYPRNFGLHPLWLLMFFPLNLGCRSTTG